MAASETSKRGQALGGHAVAPALGAAQLAPRPSTSSPRSTQRARQRQRQLRVGLDAVGRDAVDERAQRRDLALDQQVDPALAREPCGEVPGSRLDGVQQPAAVVAVVGEP